jgi:DNA gyrase subunit A
LLDKELPVVSEEPGDEDVLPGANDVPSDDMPNEDDE